MIQRRRLLPILVAAGVTLPGLYVRLAHVAVGGPLVTVLSGGAILGAAFLLLWAFDAAQADISATLSLAIVALVAVLPEYAVDMYFTWQAGQFPQGDYARFSIANMTGANRLLIGVAWTAIAAIFWLRTRRTVRIEHERRTEVLFLGAATLYGFVIPIKGSLAWYDGIVFIGLYAWYMTLAARRPCVECEAHGPAEALVRLPRLQRRTAVAAMFVFAAGAILANAKPFAEGLVSTGELFHINKFLLVQWLAPVASEAPEFTVALMFAMRGKAGMALGSLLCAELNQWTLLVGMIPSVFAISHGTLALPIPMVSLQMHEILLTAAQSLLAVVILANLRLTIGHAALLFSLFVGQFLAPVVVQHMPWAIPWHLNGDEVHQLFACMYIVTAVALVLDHPSRLLGPPKPLQPLHEAPWEAAPAWHLKSARSASLPRYNDREGVETCELL